MSVQICCLSLAPFLPDRHPDRPTEAPADELRVSAHAALVEAMPQAAHTERPRPHQGWEPGHRPSPADMISAQAARMFSPAQRARRRTAMRRRAAPPTRRMPADLRIELGELDTPRPTRTGERPKASVEGSLSRLRRVPRRTRPPSPSRRCAARCRPRRLRDGRSPQVRTPMWR